MQRQICKPYSKEDTGSKEEKDKMYYEDVKVLKG
jgi:hypothetical protein